MKHLVKYLKKEIKSSLFDYLLLITAGVLFIVAISIFRGEKIIQFLILLTFVSFYILWGIYHHVIEDTLHLKTVVEYILIAFATLFFLKLVIIP